MAIELYGIRQNLGICEDIDGSVELPDLEKINEEKYKEFKKFNIKGGVEVFRGMADAKLLADISISIKNYQRDINDEHKEKLKKYLSDSNTDRIYFPEVTLLYKYDDTKNPEEISQSIIDLEDFKTTSNVNLLARLFATGVSVLTIEDGTRLERLDGNHRLTVLKERAQGKKSSNRRNAKYTEYPENRMISYCIILVPTNQNFTFEHLYFYLLNSKSLPITPTENINLLINSNTNELQDFIKQDDFLHIMNKLKDYWKNLKDPEKKCLIDVVKEFLHSSNEQIKEKSKNIDNIIDCFKQGIGIYNKNKQHDWCVEKYISICCLIRCFSGDSDTAQSTLGKFKEWITKYKHDVTHFTRIHDLYESFTKYQEHISNKRYIFVAMQYEKEKVELYTKCIKNVLIKLKGRYENIDIELLDIMNPDDGDNIINNIMEIDIPKCDIFIADFSTNNGNVLLEYGYAKALDKFMCLLYSKDWRDKTLQELEACKNNNDSVDKVYNDLEHKIFDLRMIKDTEWDSSKKLEELLEERFEKYIKEKIID